ncbi:uncharacterized protein G2W53_005096 [Senna tora]|uniref:Uncharacterized protein n=1 Tax=Senna tora TaxID=362788 RepID=A0A834XCA6_9FABA|nr:uncharacterized protein G2W53_005096 [Senna tora]
MAQSSSEKKVNKRGNSITNYVMSPCMILRVAAACLEIRLGYTRLAFAEDGTLQGPFCRLSPLSRLFQIEPLD